MLATGPRVFLHTSLAASSHPSFSASFYFVEQFVGVGCRQVQVNDPFNTKSQPNNQTQQDNTHKFCTTFNEFFFQDVVKGLIA
jgi:hypothetical protein